jgi:hypothetical protein
VPEELVVTALELGALTKIRVGIDEEIRSENARKLLIEFFFKTIPSIRQTVIQVISPPGLTPCGAWVFRTQKSGLGPTRGPASGKR